MLQVRNEPSFAAVVITSPLVISWFHLWGNTEGGVGLSSGKQQCIFK